MAFRSGLPDVVESNHLDASWDRNAQVMAKRVQCDKCVGTIGRKQGTGGEMRPEVCPDPPGGRAHPPANRRTRCSRPCPVDGISNGAPWTPPRKGSVPSSHLISCGPMCNAVMSSRDSVSILMPPIRTEPSLEWRSTTCPTTEIPRRFIRNGPECGHFVRTVSQRADLRKGKSEIFHMLSMSKGCGPGHHEIAEEDMETKFTRLNRKLDELQQQILCNCE